MAQLGLDVLTADENKYVPFAMTLLRKMKIARKMTRAPAMSRTWQFDGVTIFVSSSTWSDFIKIRVAAGDPYISTVLADGQAASEVANTITNGSMFGIGEYSYGVFSIWVKHPAVEVDGDAFTITITDANRPTTGWSIAGGPKTGITVSWTPSPADGGGAFADFTVTTDSPVAYQSGWTNYLFSYSPLDASTLFPGDPGAWFYMSDLEIPITWATSSGFATTILGQVSPDINISLANGYCFGAFHWLKELDSALDLDIEANRRYFIDASGFAVEPIGLKPLFQQTINAPLKLASPGANLGGGGQLGSSYYYDGMTLTSKNFKACSGTPFPPA